MGDQATRVQGCFRSCRENAPSASPTRRRMLEARNIASGPPRIRTPYSTCTTGTSKLLLSTRPCSFFYVAAAWDHQPWRLDSGLSATLVALAFVHDFFFTFSYKKNLPELPSTLQSRHTNFQPQRPIRGSWVDFLHLVSPHYLSSNYTSFERKPHNPTLRKYRTLRLGQAARS